MDKSCVCLVEYKDIKDFNGQKILLFFNTDINKIMIRKHLPDSFKEDKRIKSPFATFEPTKDGWEAAIFLAANLE